MRTHLLILFTALASSAAHAQDLDPTLKKIKSNGSITIGFRESALPFSFADPHGNPSGYTVDLCNFAVEAIRQYLGMEQLKPKFVQLKATERMSKVLDGTVDLECGATTNLKERARLLTFSNAIFYSETKILVREASGIRNIDGLKGKRVILTQGAIGATTLAKIDAQKQLNIQYVRARENSESYKALEHGEVDAFVHDDVQLAWFTAKSASPMAYRTLDEVLSSDPLGIVMRKDDVKLAYIVNATLNSLYHSGEFRKLYAKWFQTRTFTFPMGPALRKNLDAPNNMPLN